MSISRTYCYRTTLFALASLSISSLLLYFYGAARFSTLAVILSAVEVGGLLVYWVTATRMADDDAKHLLSSGISAGCLATLAYDVLRVPIAHAGIPVFKAISYFGTVLLAVDRPTTSSEIAGWAYHFSNGISFGLMYAALAIKPGPITAVLWGLSLELAMLLTPYAEVFGYQRDAKFLAITIGSHAAYGLALWIGLRWRHIQKLPLRSLLYSGSVGAAILGLALVAADFHRAYAGKIPHSPPAYVGPELYTTWNVAEPDRVCALWVMSRFGERDVKFYFVEPFEKLRFGIPFDVPEARIRRYGLQSATEYLIAQKKITPTPKLLALARMTNLAEVSPWMLSSDGDADRLATLIRSAAEKSCGRDLTMHCLPEMFRELDSWYGQGSK